MSLAGVGACTLSALFSKNAKDNLVIDLANLGDSGAVIISNSSYGNKYIGNKLTTQQNANNPKEQYRLRQEHPNEDDII